MRLHTDTITRQDVQNVADSLGLTLHDFDEKGSRSHSRAFVIYLEGSSNRDSNGRDHKAATWDEWGMFIAELYKIDDTAMWGSKAWGYKDSSDFHRQTCDRFVTRPTDLHIQHKWVYDYQNSQPFSGVSVHKCNGCSAGMRRG